MEPIRQSLVVDASPVLAFEVFTLGMGSWWDAAYSPDPDSFGGIAIGPEVGAPVAMVHGDSALESNTFTWGHVTSWEPGARYDQTFWLAMDPAYPSTLEVMFTAEGPGGAGRLRARRVERRQRVVPGEVRRLEPPAREVRRSRLTGGLTTGPDVRP